MFPKIFSSIVSVFIFWIANSDSDSLYTPELGVENVLRDLGFSPSCVSKALSTCENSVENNYVMDELNQINEVLKSIKKTSEEKIKPKNCYDILQSGDKESGIRTVYPYKCCENYPVVVLCDQNTEDGGWTVIQHREALPQRENFFRKWTEYKLGFGKLNEEFWLGLDHIHAIASNSLMKLRIDLEDFSGERRWAKYSYFYIEDEENYYRLDLGDYSGNAGDSFSGHSGNEFSTKDKDRDAHEANCAQSFRGAWWYNKCHASNLNGYQHEGTHTSYADGINWKQFRGYNYSLKLSTMSVKPYI